MEVAPTSIGNPPDRSVISSSIFRFALTSLGESMWGSWTSSMSVIGYRWRHDESGQVGSGMNLV